MEAQSDPMELIGGNLNSKGSIVDGSAQRARSSLGFEYDAQLRNIISRHGNLEDIRHRLALSKRKMSQLLLVDPSAWTRWTRPGALAPPHIYRALEWYLILQGKYPGMDNAFWLHAVSKLSENKSNVELRSQNQNSRVDNEALKMSESFNLKVQLLKTQVKRLQIIGSLGFLLLILSHFI